MKHHDWYDRGALVLMSGVGVLFGLSREQAWGFILVGGAVMFVALVASLVHLWRHGKPRVIGAKAAERMTEAGPGVVTTTMRDEVRR